MKKILVVSILALVLATSCAKRKANKETTDFEDNSLAEVGFNDALKVAESAMADSSLNKSTSYFKSVFGACATVTINPPAGTTTFPKTITVDFGNGGCVDTYDIERKGKVIVTLTDKYRNTGSVTTLTTENFYVEGYKIEGTKTVTNKGTNAAGNLEYSVEITNGKITYPDGDVTTMESSRVREWIEGESTPLNPFDDVYSITGTAEGVNRDGRAYTLTVTSALRVQLNCRWITKGTMEIQPEDLKLRTVDFGDGSCDNDATVNIGKKTYPIEMK
ncbi:MAG: hypothetical protein ACLGGV_06925 [Bacteroidia bacterium]